MTPPPAPGVRGLLAELFDPGSIDWTDEDVVAGDPLGFTDTRPYPERLEVARSRSGGSESTLCGTASVDGRATAFVASDFAFMAGTQGLAAGERIARAFDRARVAGLPLVGLPRSGGTRMQEGTLGFLQMAKVAAAVERFRAAGGLYVAYLRSPTMGGVLGSWAGLGGVTWAEPDALIALTGPRVARALTGRRTPEQALRAEHRRLRGWLDDVVGPGELRTRLAELFAVTADRAARTAGGSPEGGDLGPQGPRNVPPLEPGAGWAAVLASRDPGRPGIRDLLALSEVPAVPLAGDGAGDDDPGCLVVLARYGGRCAVVVGPDRPAGGRGVALGPHGYRKARRGMARAEDLGLPLVLVADTAGARTDADAAAGGLGFEVAGCLATLSRVAVPTVSLLLGEGSGGGAIALLPADRILAVEDAWLGPIAPEGASEILHRHAGEAARLADAQGITAPWLHAAGAVDRVITGSDPAARLRDLAGVLGQELGQLAGVEAAELRARRWSRLRGLGRGLLQTPAEGGR